MCLSTRRRPQRRCFLRDCETSIFAKVCFHLYIKDEVYNEAVTSLRTLVTSPWSQQVLAAEAMSFDFEFLHHVYNFWKRVIAKRNKPEKKPKKPLRIKPLPPMEAADTYDSYGRPKRSTERSTRRRNEMVTYDEDIMQDCGISSKAEAGAAADGADMMLH